MKIYEKYEVFEGHSSKLIFVFDTKEDVVEALKACKQKLTDLIYQSSDVTGLVDAEEYVQRAVELLSGVTFKVSDYKDEDDYDDARCTINPATIEQLKSVNSQVQKNIDKLKRDGAE